MTAGDLILLEKIQYLGRIRCKMTQYNNMLVKKFPKMYKSFEYIWTYLHILKVLLLFKWMYKLIVLQDVVYMASLFILLDSWIFMLSIFKMKIYADRYRYSFKHKYYINAYIFHSLQRRFPFYILILQWAHTQKWKAKMSY